jgi:TRAP-type C4-dicarboxylate transport system permease small subunit
MVRWTHRIGALLFAALLIILVIQITARFVFNQPLPWTDELAVVVYIWLILWAAALMVRPGEQVTFDLLVQSASPTIKVRMQRARYALVGGLAAIAIPKSLDYILFMQREGTPVLGLPFSWVFAPWMLLLLSIVAWNLVLLIQSFRQTPS